MLELQLNLMERSIIHIKQPLLFLLMHISLHKKFAAVLNLPAKMDKKYPCGLI